MWNPLVTDFGDFGDSEPRKKWHLPEWAIVPAWVLVPASLFVARYLTLSLSGFGWYHGFNEAVYTEIALSYGSDLVPTRDGAPFFDTGPWTTWMMSWSYHTLSPWPGLPGAEEAALRFGVLVAYPLAVWAAYLTGEGLYGKGKGKIAAILVATSPWVLLWFGRAQTDAWMVTGILLFLAGLANPAGRRGATLIIGGLTIGILSKQPAVLALAAVPFIHPLVNLRSTDTQRVYILAATGTIAPLLWWAAMALQYPAAFESSVEFHTYDRAQLGENWLWTVVLGLVIGCGGLLFMAWKARKPNVALAMTGGGFALFAVVDSPIGHEYYALPAVAILAIMAANWKWSTASLSACVAGSLLLCVSLLAFTGDLDDTQNRDMGFTYLNIGFVPDEWDLVPENESVAAPDRLVPQLSIYGGREVLQYGQVDPATGAFMVSWGLLDCPEIAKVPATIKNPPLRLFDCRKGSNPVSETAVGF